ncbi:MAG TPA: hypothetical protein VGP38_00665 [Rubrobacter sp.]|nr:hypothetical protein [Rubrobacter sp.]
MHIFLTTERLVLCRFTEADADNLFDLDGDHEVMRFLTHRLQARYGEGGPGVRADFPRGLA